MSLQESRHGLTFARQVPANEDDRVAYEIREDATVEDVQARIYQGAENTLRLNIQHIPTSGSPVSIVEPADDGDGKGWIDGDDDDYRWSVSVPVERGDELVVDYENRDANNAHNFRVNMDIDYMGGTERLIAGIKRFLGVR